jgi:hypothetical protein
VKVSFGFQTLVTHTYYLSCSGGRDQEDLSLKPAWALFQKHQAQKRAGGVAEAVEGLPNKHEVLSSSLVTAKRRKKNPKEIFDFLGYL